MTTPVRIAALLALVVGSVVACSHQTPACAGTSKPSTPRSNNQGRAKPSTGRTTSKVQDKPRAAIPKPTSWSQHDERAQRDWTKPYRTGHPAAPKPTVTHRAGGDYRAYPTYSGYYPYGVWPIGYGDRYGCHADQEGEAQQ